MNELAREDAEYLIGRPEFRRFLFIAIQSAGLLHHHTSADGRLGRDLSYLEGRRSLGLDLLQMTDAGQPEPLRTPTAIATLDAAIREAMNPPAPKDRKRERNPSRYDAIAGSDDE